MQQTQCPICGCDSQYWIEKEGFEIRDCQACRHRFCGWIPGSDHLAQVYSDSYFTGGGAGYSDYLAESNLLVAQGRRYGELLKSYAHPGRLLDVGAAAGFILQGLANAGWSGEGIEPNATMVRYAQEQLKLNVQVGSLETLEARSQYDVVTMIQVVAHLVNPIAAFERLSGAIRSGGYCLIETWDKDSWPARMLGKHWHEYSPPSVLQWFSRRTLTRLAEKFGLMLVASGRPKKRIAGNHAKSLLNYKLSTGVGRLVKPALAVIPDQLAIPYPSFDLFWGLYQKR